MCVCVCVCSYVYVCVYLCVCLCMSVYVCEITPVNTEKREAPVPSKRAQGEAAAPGGPGQCLHPRVPPEPFPSPCPPPPTINRM